MPSYLMSLFQLNIGGNVFGSGHKKQPSSPILPAKRNVFRLPREVSITLAEDGLYLKNSDGDIAAYIGYGRPAKIERKRMPSDPTDSHSQACIVVGILGILHLFTSDHLICISETRQAVQYPLQSAALSEPTLSIYEVIGLLAIPLNSRFDAQSAITKHASRIGSENAPMSSAEAAAAGSRHGRKDSLTYGLGAYLWPKAQPVQEQTPAHSDEHSSRKALDDRILKEAIREMRSGLYFAYDFDATRSLQHKVKCNRELRANCQAKPSVKTSPLRRKPVVAAAGLPAHYLSEPEQEVAFWKKADTRFWWNRRALFDFYKAAEK